MADVSALVVCAPGTNRDEDMVIALETAGACASRLPIAELAARPAVLDHCAILVLAGGFSYGDALGSGRIAALDLRPVLDAIRSFVERGGLVLGVCNGFQMLVRAGLLPGGGVDATLAHNERGVFDCRWVHLDVPASRCVWTQSIEDRLYVPIAHGEGRFVTDDAGLAALQSQARIALRYCNPDGTVVAGSWPANPNGAVDDIAGICDETGQILGLMPHPEDHVLARQNPRRTREGIDSGNTLALFRNGVLAVG